MTSHTERKTGNRRYPPAPVGKKNAVQDRGARPARPETRIPQSNALDLMAYREVFDLDYAMPIQREGGITLSLMTNGGELEWLARNILQASTVEGVEFFNDEYVEIIDRYPGEFVPMANAPTLEEACRPVVEEMIRQGGAKAIAVASSYGDGADRVFLDSPRRNGCGSLRKRMTSWFTSIRRCSRSGMNRSCNTALTGRSAAPRLDRQRRADGRFRRIRSPSEAAGIDRPYGRRTRVDRWTPRIQLAPQLQRDQEPAGRQALHEQAVPIRLFQDQHPSRYMGFSAIGVRAAIEMCGVDRVVFGSDLGRVPYGIKEHVQSVEEVLPSVADRELVFWKTSNRIFHLALADTGLITTDILPAAA